MTMNAAVGVGREGPQHIFVVGYRDIDFKLTGKSNPWFLVLMVLEGAMQAVWREKTSVNLPRTGPILLQYQ